MLMLIIHFSIYEPAFEKLWKEWPCAPPCTFSTIKRFKLWSVRRVYCMLWAKGENCFTSINLSSSLILLIGTKGICAFLSEQSCVCVCVCVSWRISAVVRAHTVPSVLPYTVVRMIGCISFWNSNATQRYGPRRSGVIVQPSHRLAQSSLSVLYSLHNKVWF